MLVRFAKKDSGQPFRFSFPSTMVFMSDYYGLNFIEAELAKID